MTVNLHYRKPSKTNPDSGNQMKNISSKKGGVGGLLERACFMKWGFADIVGVVKYHPLPCVFVMSLLFFMFVEYTLFMVPSSSPPFDLGFIATRSLNRFLSHSPFLNTLCAALNTVFVGMQTTYILWVFLVEGRARPGLAALFSFTCRGILGYSTQLPLPQDGRSRNQSIMRMTVWSLFIVWGIWIVCFRNARLEIVGTISEFQLLIKLPGLVLYFYFTLLFQGADFPVGNVSFFLFYSGHVASAVIASLDMRRMQRKKFAWTFDILNVLQVVRLLGTRGHYTIDLGVGVGAGMLFDSLAGRYVETRKLSVSSP